MKRLGRMWVASALSVLACGGHDGDPAPQGSRAQSGASATDEEPSPSEGGASSSGDGASSNGGFNDGGAGAVAGSGELGELITTLCADLRSLTVIDDDHVFEGCFESEEQDFDLVEQFTLRQVTSEGSKIIAVSQKPLQMLAMDATSYYIQEFQDFSKSDTRNGDIVRLPIDEMALQEFFLARDSNNDPSIEAQTDDVCVISQPAEHGYLDAVQYSASVEVVTKATGASRVIFPITTGATFDSAWIEDENVAFVMGLPEGPFVYRAPLAAGVATKGEALPSLCANFVHRSDGFLAICGDEAELVHIDEEGMITRLGRAVRSAKLYDFDRIYWAWGGIIHATDSSGVTAGLKLGDGAYVSGMTPMFAYVTIPGKDSAELRRVRLSEVR